MNKLDYFKNNIMYSNCKKKKLHKYKQKCKINFATI